MFTIMKKYIQPYFQFLQKPYYISPNKAKSMQLSPITDIVLLILFLLIVNNILIIPNKLGFINADFKADKVYDGLKKMGWPVLFFIGAFLFPLLEELIFRLHLKSVKGSYFFYVLMGAFFVSVILVQIIPRMHISLALFFLLCIVCFFILRYWFAFLPNQFHYSRKFIQYFHIHIWLSAFAFAMSHVFNYSLHSSAAILLSPLLVLPQLVGGLTLSYIRMKYGILVSILMHGIHNGILFGFIYFTETLAKV